MIDDPDLVIGEVTSLLRPNGVVGVSEVFLGLEPVKKLAKIGEFLVNLVLRYLGIDRSQPMRWEH